jgi:hypothetical protein
MFQKLNKKKIKPPLNNLIFSAENVDKLISFEKLTLPTDFWTLGAISFYFSKVNRRWLQPKKIKNG